MYHINHSTASLDSWSYMSSSQSTSSCPVQAAQMKQQNVVQPLTWKSCRRHILVLHV